MGLPYACYTFLTKSNLIGKLKTKKLKEYDNFSVSLKCLMIGRQKLSLTDIQMNSASKRDKIEKNLLQGWAEPFLKYQGCDSVSSLDNSNFESAGLLWNLNQSLSTRKNVSDIESYDLILDYGTSEHIFNPAMSIYNSIKLLKIGGIFNALLPVCGWNDHGFYQFSPSFFYSLDRKDFELQKLYFFVYDRESVDIIFWDGLSNDFKEHVHGAFDGSFAANCLEYMNKPITAWAVYKKNSKVNEDNFMHDTQQLIYKEKWNGNNLDGLNSNSEKLSIYKMPDFIKPYLFRRYLRKIALKLTEI